MFERFTDRARRVVVLAQEEARLLDHNFIGTEHLLLGMLAEGEDIAAQVLVSADISLDAARSKVEAIGRRGSSTPPGHIPFTPRAKKVLEYALREALQLGDNFIGTEHLLLALLREGQGIAIQALVNLGADLDSVREQVVALAGEARTPSQAEEFDRRVLQKPEIQPASSSRTALLHCSFCNEPQDRVAKLIAGPGVYICDRCVALCQEILDEQLPGNSEDNPDDSA